MVRFVAWKRISINFQINFEQELFTRQEGKVNFPSFQRATENIPPGKLM